MRSCVRTMRWLSPQCSIHQSQKLFSLSLCVCVCAKQQSFYAFYIMLFSKWIGWQWRVDVVNEMCMIFKWGGYILFQGADFCSFVFLFGSVLFSHPFFHSTKWNMQKCIYSSLYDSFDFDQFRWNTQRCSATTTTVAARKHHSSETH